MAEMLGVGEALVSFLDEKGIPGVVQRAMVVPPHSQIGPITPEQRAAIIRTSVLAGVYENAVDRVSAYETLKGKVAASSAAASPAAAQPSGAPAGQAPAATGGGWMSEVGGMLGGVMGTGRSGRGDTVVQAMVKSAARTMGSTVGRQIVRGVLGSLLGGGRR